jgi:hypothetical protein
MLVSDLRRLFKRDEQAPRGWDDRVELLLTDAVVVHRPALELRIELLRHARDTEA